jgi:hypothetical protein
MLKTGGQIEMAGFDDFAKALEEGVKKLAKELFDGAEAEALEDMRAFLAKSKYDLERWTLQLAEGLITEQDFSDFVQAKKALAELHALTQAGFVITKLERFRTGLINLIIDTAFKMFL